jgi:hypothetical protein
VSKLWTATANIIDWLEFAATSRGSGFK